MKRYSLTYVPAVYDQIDEQVLFIARDSIDNALAWEGRLRKVIHKLSDVRGFTIFEEASARLGYTIQKYLFENTYLVHFTVDDKTRTVRIVNFRHGGRLPKTGEP